MEVRDIKDVKSLGFYKQLVVGDQETTRIECFWEVKANMES